MVIIIFHANRSSFYFASFSKAYKTCFLLTPPRAWFGNRSKRFSAKNLNLLYFENSYSVFCQNFLCILSLIIFAAFSAIPYRKVNPVFFFFFWDHRKSVALKVIQVVIVQEQVIQVKIAQGQVMQVEIVQEGTPPVTGLQEQPFTHFVLLIQCNKSDNFISFM